MRCQLGQEIGYSIRFEDVTSAKTRIKFLTDGLLLREALVDPLLTRYSVIMVDEAHERSLSTDILLGLLKKIQKRRPELSIVVSSATLDVDSFVFFFSRKQAIGSDNAMSEDDKTCKVVSIEGRSFPVDTHYLNSPCEDYVLRAVETIFQIHELEPDGDVLLFLTGREEIEIAIQMIADRLLSLPKGADSILPLPLYAGLSTEQQMWVFEPAPDHTRKVICSTNIAEASVTVNGVVFVIDCGFVKLRAYNPSTGIETLTAVPVSKASANQRAGRAGRTKAGKCYRLYTEAAFGSLPSVTVPEIQRSNLAPTILQMKALGIDNIARFDFLTPPPSELIIRALDLLYALGALDDYAKLTSPLGTRMAEMGLEPQLAKALLTSSEFSCLGEMLSIAAMVSLQGSVWFSHDEKKKEETARRKFAVEEGDHLTLLNIYEAFFRKGRKDTKWCQQHYINFKSLTRAVSIRNQLRRYLERFGIDVSSTTAENQASSVLRVGGVAHPINKAEQIRRCLSSGYFAQAAQMQPDGTFKTINGDMTLHAHPSSLMFNRKADWVIFGELIESGEKKFVRDVTKIERSWLLEYAPGYYRVKS
ncbi:P-loop containing nucleoside triphosphate hydrolase protein [Polychaeton citri CBS 116435]|uniref:RNA helicase n=1 Tax=Polychaeton citri CBS 116435 TaxID=1314669 RepID=A0A9P4Q8J3_9PEZI|nr:P-loop containing nucleoside triphosphate hydrolase protein [Polychaeton citri CBS 116435]